MNSSCDSPDGTAGLCFDPNMTTTAHNDFAQMEIQVQTRDIHQTSGTDTEKINKTVSRVQRERGSRHAEGRGRCVAGKGCTEAWARLQRGNGRGGERGNSDGDSGWVGGGAGEGRTCSDEYVLTRKMDRGRRKDLNVKLRCLNILQQRKRMRPNHTLEEETASI